MNRSRSNDADTARESLISALHSTGAGDASALRKVYDLTSAKLFGICLRISGSREAAEDILQDVYVKVWRRAGAFDASRASPISWLATIARNSAIDWRRAERPYEALPDDILASVADASPLADEILEQDDAHRRLFACLEGLPAAEATAIRRAFLGGLTYQQFADLTDTPLGTIKSWIRRGMQKLKECLADG